MAVLDPTLIQTEAISELAQIGATYGFPALFAILFWRYIKEVQQKQTETLRDLSMAVTRMEDMMFVEEINRSRERSDGGTDEDERNGP